MLITIFCKSHQYLSVPWEPYHYPPTSYLFLISDTRTRDVDNNRSVPGPGHTIISDNTQKIFLLWSHPVPPSGNLTSLEYKNIKYLCSLSIFTDPASGAGRKSFINCLQWLWRWTDPYRVWIRGGHSLSWMHLHLQLAVRMETQVSMALMKNVPMGQESVTGTE